MQLFSSWTGSDFLLFYTLMLGLGIVAAWWIPANLRGAGRRSESPDPEDVALLAGGRERHTDTVIADLYARGGLIAAESNKLAVSDPGVAASPAGRILLGVRQPFDRGEADNLLSVRVQRIAARLRREGLLLRDEDHLRLRWLSIAPFGVLLMAAIGLLWVAPAPVVTTAPKTPPSMAEPLRTPAFRRLLAIYLVNGVASAVPISSR